MASQNLPPIQEKYRKLLTALGKYRHAAVAFSGGVDSTLLFHAAREAIGTKNVIAVRAVSELVSRSDFRFGEQMLDEMNVASRNRMDIYHNIFDVTEFISNTASRCYHCKSHMYSSFLYHLREKGEFVLLDGTNSDDLLQLRPGQQAIAELSIPTPLADAALSKGEIRTLARSFGLSNYDKISNSCLATRIVSGMVIAKEKLAWIEDCEDYLMECGFLGCRVRINEENVTVEVEKRDFNRLQESAVRYEIVKFFLKRGCRDTAIFFDIRS